LFKEDDSFSSVFSGQKDADLSRLKILFEGGFSGLSGRSTEVDLLVIGLVPFGYLASNSSLFLRGHN
jgi:hypothetical protein